MWRSWTPDLVSCPHSVVVLPVAAAVAIEPDSSNPFEAPATSRGKSLATNRARRCTWAGHTHCNAQLATRLCARATIKCSTRLRCNTCGCDLEPLKGQARSCHAECTSVRDTPGTMASRSSALSEGTARRRLRSDEGVDHVQLDASGADKEAHKDKLVGRSTRDGSVSFLCRPCGTI